MIALTGSHRVAVLKKVRLSLRIAFSRWEKLRQLAVEREKTMTQMVEDWIDSLPKPKGDGG
jgi:predicted DNA-binding ribbon-helix-helix protein